MTPRPSTPSSPPSPDGAQHHQLSWSTSTPASCAKSVISCVWTPACRPRGDAYASPPAHAATARGCLVQVSAQARPRGPLRLRLPDPAQGRCGGPRRPLGRDRGLLRSARLGRGVPARARAGSVGRHIGPAVRRGPHCPWPPRRTTAPPPRSAVWSKPTRMWSSTFEMSVSRLIDPVRITKPFEGRRWRALDRAGRRSWTSTWPRATCA